MEPGRLNNTYFALRHGQSMANVKDLIVSDPETGVANYGLSETGRDQAAKAFDNCPGLGADTLIISSDFLRTRETAAIAARVLGVESDIRFTPLLRERFFGKWEMTTGWNYDCVWALDVKGETEPGSRVEPVGNVLSRGLACLKELETDFQGRHILLVSHGDTLQILMTFFAGLSPYLHRNLPHLETAEVRRLSI